MIADLLLFLFFAGTFLVVLPAFLAEVRDMHRRGVARVHAGTSWSDRCCLDARDGVDCECQVAA